MATELAPKLVIRPLGPADRDLLLEGFARLSDQSRYLRFFTAKPTLTPHDLRYLTELDGVSHYALGAAVRRGDGTLRGLGVARYVLAHDDLGTAHVAVAIADDAQRHGVATQLLRGLAYAAVLRGIERFRFTLLPENVPMRTFLATHRVPMVVRDGLIVGEWPTLRAARIRSSKRWRSLLA